MHSIGIGRTRVIILSQDRDIRIIDAATGELLRELVLAIRRGWWTGRSNPHRSWTGDISVMPPSYAT